jgi:hypothetical protein
MSNNKVFVERVENKVIVSASGVQGPRGYQGEQGPQGIPGDPATGSFVHTQDIASDTWVINHNLQYFPNVEIVDSAGSSIIGEYQFLNINTVIARFADPFAGKAYLS